MSDKKLKQDKSVRRVMYFLAVLSMAFTVVETFITLPQIPLPAANEPIGPYIREALGALSNAGLGLIGAVFFSVIGITWDMNLWLERVSETLNETVDHFDNVVECRYFGLGSQTLLQILDRLELAQNVRNTFVLFGISESDAYDKNQFEEVSKRIEPFLRKGGNWTDIISQDVVNSPTARWLGLFRSLHHKSKDPDHGSLAKAAMDRYRIRQLKGIYPLINFIILQYGDGSEEVIFGWGHHAEDPGGRVFLSRNRRLIGTFDQYWKMLEKDSVPIGIQARPIIATEITGLWFRIAFLVDYDWKARAGIPPQPNKFPYDMALVKINLKENRNLAIEGRRFKVFDETSDTEVVTGDSANDPNENIRIERVNSFDSKAADLDRSRLWFSTTSASDEKLHIAGWYRFVQDERDAKPGDTRFKKFYGEFVEYQEAPEIISKTESKSSFKYKVGRLVLFGCRIPAEWGNGESGNYLTEFPDSPHDQIDLITKCFNWWNREGMKEWEYTTLSPEDLDEGD